MREGPKLPTTTLSPGALALRRAYRESGLSQGELARLAGVDVRSVRRWLAGVNPVPALDLFVALQEHAARANLRRAA